MGRSERYLEVGSTRLGEGQRKKSRMTPGFPEGTAVWMVELRAKVENLRGKHWEEKMRRSMSVMLSFRWMRNVQWSGKKESPEFRHQVWQKLKFKSHHFIHELKPGK